MWGPWGTQLGFPWEGELGALACGRRGVVCTRRNTGTYGSLAPSPCPSVRALTQLWTTVCPDTCHEGHGVIILEKFGTRPHAHLHSPGPGPLFPTADARPRLTTGQAAAWVVLESGPPPPHARAGDGGAAAEHNPQPTSSREKKHRGVAYTPGHARTPRGRPGAEGRG